MTARGRRRRSVIRTCPIRTLRYRCRRRRGRCGKGSGLLSARHARKLAKMRHLRAGEAEGGEIGRALTWDERADAAEHSDIALQLDEMLSELTAVAVEPLRLRFELVAVPGTRG